MPVPDRLLDVLTTALGPAGVLTAADSPDDVAGHVVDWRGAHRGTTPAVLRPGSTADVAAAVRLCHEAGVALVPQGGNTGLCGGCIPDASGSQLVLWLGRMRAVRDVDPVGGSATVEAGVTLRGLQDAAAAVGRLFPLSLGSEGSATVGGVLATNAGGTGVLRYGMMRDLTLGLEVVLPDGQVWDGLRALRKDNTGYDLKQLFVGAEGTLGVITAATVRLLPATPARATAWVAVRDVAAAVGLLAVAQEHAASDLTTVEIVSREAVGLVLDHAPGARDPFAAAHPWYVLVELAGSVTEVVHHRLEEVLVAADERGLVADAVVAGGPAQRTALWLLREGVSEVQGHAGPSLKHDVTVPIAALPDLVSATDRALGAVLPGVRRITYGHVGDGNLHHNLSAPVGAPHAVLLEKADALSTAIYDEVARLGGSISAEHGLGSAKRDLADVYGDPVERELMRTVKRALDPRGLMNPGKVV